MTETVALVLCTVPEAEARGLVDQLLAERRIACANLLGPVSSRYRWEGRVEESREVLLVLKTTVAATPALRQRIGELHSYDVPEVLEFHADGGLPAYLQWVAESCGDGAG
ncbi:MAG: divalent-cation tolerance protein CutA [Planctomycetota bacterium]